MPATYTRTIALPAGGSTVTLYDWPVETATHLEVLKLDGVTDALWLNLGADGPSPAEADDMEVVPDGSPWAKFNVNRMFHRADRRAGGGNYTFVVEAAAAMSVQFKAV